MQDLRGLSSVCRFVNHAGKLAGTIGLRSGEGWEGDKGVISCPRGSTVESMKFSPPTLDRFHWILLVVVGISFVYMEYITWTQYAANLVFMVDAGLIDMISAGLVHGNFLRYPLRWHVEANYFAGHFRPILFLVMPFYFVADHVMTLLSLKNLALAGAAIPLGLMARTIIGRDELALGVVLLYLANHFTGSIHLANHPESFALVGMFTFFLGAVRRNPWLFFGGMVWAWMVKEDYPIYTAAFCFSLLFSRDRRLLTWSVAGMLLSVLWFGLALWVMRLSGQEALHEAGQIPLARFEDMGETKPEIVLYMMTHPIETLGRIFRWPLFWLLASTGFLALLDWRRNWMVVMGASVFMVTGDPITRELLYYYSYPAIPFLMYSTTVGVSALLRWMPRENRILVPATGVFLLLVSIVNGVLPTRTDGYYRLPFAVTDRHRMVPAIVSIVPDEDPIAVQYDLYARVPNRPVKLPVRERFLDEVDWVLIDSEGRPADLWGGDRLDEVDAILERLNSDEFVIEFQGEGYYLFHRAEPPPSLGEDDEVIHEELEEE